MKLGKIFLGLVFANFISNAIAAQNIEIYYSPTCPHCHHAMNFIDKTLSVQYKDLQVNKVNVTEQQNRDLFVTVLKKCKFQSGGVPVIVVNDKCFQGYAEFMNTDIMAALGAADVASDKVIADAKDESVAQLPPEQIHPADKGTTTMLYVLLGLLVAALGVVLFVKKKK